MTNSVAVTAAASPLDFGENTTTLSQRNDVNRDKTRYVACLGNHMEPGDARQLNSIGGWAGGLWVGHSENEGVPTMTRTHHMVLRGLFTPLETRAVMKKADHRESEAHREVYLDGPGVPPFTRGYTIYAGDDLAYLQSDRYRPMGVVEISPLMGVEWKTELRKTLQGFFFPEWEVWQKGQGEIPILLDDWVTLVKQAQQKAQYQNQDIIAEELLESARLFRVYANNQIEKNRQAIQAMRSGDHGGFFIGWHNKTRMYAEQLGVTLEDEKALAPAAAADTSGIVTEMREDRKLREQELAAQREYNKILMAKLGVETEEVVVETPDAVTPAPPVLDLMDSVSFGAPEVEPEVSQVEEEEPEGELNLGPMEDPKELTQGCTEVNGKGEACKGKVYPGETKCIFHNK